MLLSRNSRNRFVGGNHESRTTDKDHTASQQIWNSRITAGFNIPESRRLKVCQIPDPAEPLPNPDTTLPLLGFCLVLYICFPYLLSVRSVFVQPQ